MGSGGRRRGFDPIRELEFLHFDIAVSMPQSADDSSFPIWRDHESLVFVGLDVLRHGRLLAFVFVRKIQHRTAGGSRLVDGRDLGLRTGSDLGLSSEEVIKFSVALLQRAKHF